MADSLLEDLTAIAVVATTDVLYVVADPGGTPLDRQVSVGDLLSSIMPSIDHGSIDGLADDDHAQYPLGVGRPGGQMLIGGTVSGDLLWFLSDTFNEGIIQLDTIFYANNNLWCSVGNTTGAGASVGVSSGVNFLAFRNGTLPSSLINCCAVVASDFAAGDSRLNVMSEDGTVVKLGGGQVIAASFAGGSGSGGGVTIYSTTHATKGVISLADGVALPAVISPAQLTANTDNYAPTGIGSAFALRLSTDASRNLTGITGGAEGRTLLIHNIGSFDLVLVHDATSTAGNRFLLPSATNLTVGAGSSVLLRYDATSSRWRPAGGAGGGGGVSDHGALTGLADDDHTQYALLAGRAGGQSASGGTASGEHLTLASTAHATKGQVKIADGFGLTGVISPTQITANTDNYSPTGLAGAAVLRINTDANDRQITGIAGGADGRILIVHNVGSFRILLINDATSTAANRLLLPGANNMYLAADSTIVFRYDGTSSRWRSVAEGNRHLENFNSNSGTLPTNRGGTGASNSTVTKGDVLAAVSGGTFTRLAVGANEKVLTADSAETQGVKWADVPFPPKFRQGFFWSRNTTDTTNDVDITSGDCRDDTDVDNMSTAGTIVKQLDAAWAVGTNAGGLDTGARANNTWYYIWVIKRPDTGVVDILLSVSNSAPTLPTNYTLKRLVGAIKTGASVLTRVRVRTVTSGIYVGYVSPQDQGLDVDTAVLGTTRTDFTLASVPPVPQANLQPEVDCNVSISASAANRVVHISNPNSSTVAASATASPLGALVTQVASQAIHGRIHVYTDDASVISAVATAASTTFKVQVMGYYWPNEL